jgi:transposase-like protein
MTYHEDFTLPAELMAQVQEQGLDVLPELIRVIINTAMQAERAEHLNAAHYQHNPERSGYANGYKPKTMRTRVGDITFAIPQVREGGFYPQALEKGLRSERALTLALAEMYVQGVSTRKVKAITEQLCGVNVSSSMVSQAAAQMDAELEKWRERPLGEYPFLFLDAYYEQVREDGQVRDLAVLVAVGVNPQGKREILGVSVSLSEHEIHWRTFLESLKKRGLGGVQLITSDDHAGLRAARLAVFGSLPWQRCQFHLQQNAHSNRFIITNTTINNGDWYEWGARVFYQYDLYAIVTPQKKRILFQGKNVRFIDFPIRPSQDTLVGSYAS